MNKALLAMLLLLVSCSMNPRQLDSGLMIGKPCAAPCWNGLTPGKSSVEDVNAFIVTLNKTEWKGREDFSGMFGCTDIQVSDVPGRQVNRLVDFQIQSETLMIISSASPGLPNLGKIVDRLGPPQYAKVLHAIGPDGDAYFVEVYYPGKGLAIQIDTQGRAVDEIRRDMPISLVHYFAPGDLLSYFTRYGSCYVGYEGALANARIDIADVRPWPGFGKVTPVISR